jgi:hypothetical protein
MYYSGTWVYHRPVQCKWRRAISDIGDGVWPVRFAL